MSLPVFSVVVASRQRRRGLLLTLESLAGQIAPPPFQVLVVLDGSTDGSAEAVAAADLPFEPMVLEQSRRGLHYARDLGASAARGEFILFLDDDSRGDPRLLAHIHDRHDTGVPAVQPVIELQGGSAQTVLSTFARRWALRRQERLAGAELRPADACAAPLSVAAATFGAVREKSGPPGYATSGFGEDFRLGQALNAAGARIEYCPDAGCQFEVPASVALLLERSWEMGQADAELAADAPDTASSIDAARAQRWVVTEAAARAVERDPGRAAARCAQIERELIAEARRGMADAASLARLDEGVALEYALGRAGHPMPADRRT